MDGGEYFCASPVGEVKNAPFEELAEKGRGGFSQMEGVGGSNGNVAGSPPTRWFAGRKMKITVGPSSLSLLRELERTYHFFLPRGG